MLGRAWAREVFPGHSALRWAHWGAANIERSEMSARLSAAAVFGFAAGASAQSAVETAKQFAPGGKLRVGVLMLSYFALEQDGQLKGWSPDIGIELARRLGV